jgi:hypothetical protein
MHWTERAGELRAAGETVRFHVTFDDALGLVVDDESFAQIAELRGADVGLTEAPVRLPGRIAGWLELVAHLAPDRATRQRLRLLDRDLVALRPFRLPKPDIDLDRIVERLGFEPAGWTQVLFGECLLADGWVELGDGRFVERFEGGQFVGCWARVRSDHVLTGAESDGSGRL